MRSDVMSHVGRVVVGEERQRRVHRQEAGGRPPASARRVRASTLEKRRSPAQDGGSRDQAPAEPAAGRPRASGTGPRAARAPRASARAAPVLRRRPERRSQQPGEEHGRERARRGRRRGPDEPQAAAAHRDLVDEDLRPPHVRAGHDRPRRAGRARPRAPPGAAPPPGSSSAYRSHGPVSTSVSRTATPCTNAPSDERTGARARKERVTVPRSARAGAASRRRGADGSRRSGARRGWPAGRGRPASPSPTAPTGRACRTRRSRRGAPAPAARARARRSRRTGPAARRASRHRDRGGFWESAIHGREGASHGNRRAVNTPVDYGQVCWILLQSHGLGCRAPGRRYRSPSRRQRAVRTKERGEARHFEQGFRRQPELRRHPR